MAELRHSSSMGNRTPHTPSPIKRVASAAAKSFFSSDISVSEDNDDAERRRSSGRDLFLKIRRLLEDPRNKVWVLLGFGFLIMFGSVVLLLVWRRLSSPYLCYRDGSGIGLRCPEVKEATSLWENPYASTVSWKPCAERQVNVISDFPPENETSGYIFIHAEGGLNQQRIAICNAVAVAKILNATLILPVLKQDQIWKDKTNFEDIFDVDHFIDYLKDDVRIVRDIPDWFTDKTELFTSIK